MSFLLRSNRGIVYQSGMDISNVLGILVAFPQYFDTKCFGTLRKHSSTYAGTTYIQQAAVDIQYIPFHQPLLLHRGNTCSALWTENSIGHRHW